jgi:hypothetical protein
VAHSALLLRKLNVQCIITYKKGDLVVECLTLQKTQRHSDNTRWPKKARTHGSERGHLDTKDGRRDEISEKEESEKEVRADEALESECTESASENSEKAYGD